ncbi:alkaline phosphatase family protein [Prosthecobacter sp.]|uniref:alkaline phosphatase family protein n=1 Tax=Prosthecobacter sp. TaxID=1965333 RepID=UPI003784976D
MHSKVNTILPTLTLSFLVACLSIFISPEAHASGPGNQNDFQGRRVLLIGIDGCRRDAMAQVIAGGSAPNLARLSREGHACWNMEAGGPLIGKMNQPTISGPGWSTLLTGVFANKHGVLGNGEKFKKGNFQSFPHFFRRLRESKPNPWLGSVVGDTWPEVNSILIPLSGEMLTSRTTTVPSEQDEEQGKTRRLNDGNVAKEAVRCLEMDDPDVLFLHFLDVDHAGHQFGFGPASDPYIKTLQRLDSHLGAVLEAMKKRPRFTEESWLIVVMTDHGGIKKSHGGQTPEERDIFAFFHAASFPPVEERSGKVFQSMVVPTILNYLRVPILPSWGLEDQPLSETK